ncbi:hypothetical protein IWW34DRAFT_812471 [Fusarium oxysporum f. sp. albedinis]|nr:hypothetical protein IWW34DRAFT_812471 [Fusarium oxysporum f. sp. albedinis]
MRESYCMFHHKGDAVLIHSTNCHESFQWSDERLSIHAHTPAESTAIKVKNPKTKVEDIPAMEEPAAMPVGEGPVLNKMFTLTEDIHFGEYPSDAPEEVYYRMLVSSSHLVLASPVFQAMVEGPYVEGSTDHRGIYQFTTHGWNQEAFVIVLDIIHGHHRSVPKSLDLEMLAKVAVIVDYYKCHEIVEVFAERWLKALQNGHTVHYGKASMLWLLISWVFSCPEIFKSMAGLVLKHSTRLILADNVPIPGEVLDRIDQERQGALSKVFTTLYGLLDTLQHNSDCSYECSCMLLGNLTKELGENGILKPPIEPPFEGHSIVSVMEMISGFSSVNWYSRSSSGMYYDGYHSSHSCSIVGKMRPTLERMEKELPCLGLEDFGLLTEH